MGMHFPICKLKTADFQGSKKRFKSNENMSYPELLCKYVETRDVQHTPSLPWDRTQFEGYLRFHLRSKPAENSKWPNLPSTCRIILTNNKDWNFDSFALSAFH